VGEPRVKSTLRGMTQAIAAALILFWTCSANAAETTWGILQRFGLGYLGRIAPATIRKSKSASV
jgi:hypothetical protein